MLYPPPIWSNRALRKIIVGFSGGVTSAWALGWALLSFPRNEVVALFHDTKSEDVDTYRFLREMATRLDVPIVERSDGRSVEEVEDDEGALANNRMAFCSRILKVEQRDKYFEELRATGITEIVNVLGFLAHEWQRVQRATMRAEQGSYTARFPGVEQQMTKQACADWCIGLGVRPPRMYEWSDHANCPGCRRGGKTYWLAVREHRPDVFERAKQREMSFDHTIINGCSLVTLERDGMKRPAKRREAISIGSCECGD